MTFLQPVLLWALPAALLPVLIHLLNRLRFRSVKWAAMMFLVSATRSAARRARLRHWLVMACRCALILFFVLAAARPLAGGWLGLVASSAPDTAIVLLDRSASMERRDAVTGTGLREKAIDTLSASSGFGRGASSCVFIENASRTPQQVADMGAIRDLTLAGPSDTACDMPAMFRAALDCMTSGRSGRTEIWVASDLQRSNWRPESPEWENIAAALGAWGADVRVRVLAVSGGGSANRSVRMNGAEKRTSAGRPFLSLKVDLSRTQGAGASFPAIVTIDGNRSQVDVTMASENYRLALKPDLPGDRLSNGWGKVEIPSDDNPRDNACYVAFGEPGLMKAVVAASDPAAGGILRLALCPASDRFGRSAVRVEAADLASMGLADAALVVIQGNPPSGAAGAALGKYVESGGVVAVFPPSADGPAAAGSNSLGVAWKAMETAQKDRPFRVPVWDENDGVLSRSDNGRNLDVGDLSVATRRLPVVDGLSGVAWHGIAHYQDNEPFLFQGRLGGGSVFVFTTLPVESWSDLGEGRVLVPALQRMLFMGAGRLLACANGICGEWQPPGDGGEWLPADGRESGNPLYEAGVYRSGEQMVALNRPAAEDDPQSLEKEEVKRLFGDVRVDLVEETAGAATGAGGGEVWRMLVVLAFLALVAEACLLLFEKAPGRARGAERSRAA